jgi:hypothetical protein
VASASLSAEDLASLRQLVDAYADSVDRRDRLALMALFTDDAEVRVQTEDGPVEQSWRGERIGHLLDAVADYHRTFHHVGGAVFDRADDGAATGRTHCLAHHYDRSRNGPTDLVMMIRYYDRFACGDDGRWRFTDRQLIVDWTELHPAHPVRRSAGGPTTG